MQQRTLLIFETDIHVRRMLVRVFERDGIDVYAATSLEDACGAGTESYDVVLCDLAGLKGTMQDDIRKLSAAHREARLVLLSAGHELGHADFGPDVVLVSKPFRIDEIRALVSALLKNREHDTRKRGK